jgi:hypothetical protein
LRSTNTSGIAAGLDLGREAPVLAGERHQGRRTAKDDENPVRLAIDRHRKIRFRPLRRRRSGRPDREVGHDDLMRVRHIHKDLSPGVVDLKPSGCALSRMSAVFNSFTGSIAASAPLP